MGVIIIPRRARILSESQIYHVMLRGNNKEAIFIDDHDKNRIIDTLMDKKSGGAYYLYSYCVMDNHLHLVIKEGENNLSKALRRIATSYAHYFNKKYKRVGHVFQDRYRSECVEDDRYLLAVIRYVHQNPWKAAIGTIEEYKWSSFKAYMQNIQGMREVSEILAMISNDKTHAVKEFYRFNHENIDEQFIDIGLDKEINEGNITEYINKYLIEKNISMDGLQFRNNRGIRNELIRILLEKSDLSKRSIANVLGINRETVRVLSKEPSP